VEAPSRTWQAARFTGYGQASLAVRDLYGVEEIWPKRSTA
jgi:hypothetical protein